MSLAALIPEHDLLPTLRVLTCGSVDDGKSTLIGRLLFEAGAIPHDQFAALQRDSRAHGTTGEDVDFSLLVDGLEAEREQGITIDVAYRYFNTARRSFVIADTPGHEQYTRNMATGASNAELAILLVDARKGLLTQTQRHATIVALLGIRRVVLAINKVDLVAYDHATVQAIERAFRQFAERLDFDSVTVIPISARHGDNLSARSPAMPWYEGPTLLEFLERIDIPDARAAKPFRLPVQSVNRPTSEFRGYAGTVASGRIRPGDEIVVAGSGRSTTVSRIVTADGDLAEAEAGDAVTLTLTDEIDIGRGEVLAPPRARPEVGDSFAAELIWMGEEDLRVGGPYFLKLAACTVPAVVRAVDDRLEVATGERLPAATLRLNEIGRARIGTATPIAFDAYRHNAVTGAFILIDRANNATVAAGLVLHGLRKATNVYRQPGLVSAGERALMMHQTPGVLWFTGLPSAGKSTIANAVEARLQGAGIHTFGLDGDNLRLGLSSDLGFSPADRLENIRRVAEVARLMVDAGLVVLCSFISPFAEERALARDIVGAERFVEVFVDTPLTTCIARDTKGLYRRALAGEIKDFTGVDQAYEAPESPDVVLGHADESIEDAASRVVKTALARGIGR